MSGAELLAISPWLALAETPLAALIAVMIRRSAAVVAWVSVLGLAVSAALIPAAASVAPVQVTPLVRVDDYALFFLGVVLLSTLAAVILAHGHLRKRGGAPPEELYILFLLAALGAAILTAADHFASLFLGLETLSVSLYGLIAYLRTERPGLEAGVKYLILAATSSAVLLFGAALVYAAGGALDFAGMLAASGPLVAPGLILIVAGLAFKLALVPFHMWTPDVYQGAAAPVTAFVATASKSAVLAVVLRLLAAPPPPVLVVALWVMAVASMFAGNVLALMQRNVKRVLAYSSIAHLGYALVALIAGGVAAAAFYMAAYTVTTLLSFGVVTVLSPPDRDADRLDDFRGLCWRRPELGALWVASLLSLAGIPLTAGFIAKLYVVVAGAGAALWALVVLVAVNSALGLFYYLRLVVVAFGDGHARPARERVPAASAVVFGVLIVALIGLGVRPDLLQPLLDAAAAALR